MTELNAWHPYPWQMDHWSRFCLQLSQDRLPHALLVSGLSDSGKLQLSSAMAARLLCMNSTDESAACGECPRCRLVQARSHPDLLTVTLEESKQIKVEQIRELIDWAWQTSQQGGRKVCLVYPADCLNLAAANALLKSLEEPPKDTVLILVTDRPGKLLPTIRSRCQMIDLALPTRESALHWMKQQGYTGDVDAALLLEIAGGSPLRALNVVTDEYLKVRGEIAARLVPLARGENSPVQMAAALISHDPMLVLDILYHLVADSVVLSLSGEAALRNRDLLSALSEYGELLSVGQRYELMDRIQSARGTLGGTSNANAQMLLEWVLLDVA